MTYTRTSKELSLLDGSLCSGCTGAEDAIPHRRDADVEVADCQPEPCTRDEEGEVALLDRLDCGQWELFSAGVLNMTLPADTQWTLHLFAARNGSTLRCSLLDAEGKPARVVVFRRVPGAATLSSGLNVEVMLTLNGCTRWREWRSLPQQTAAAAVDVVLRAAGSLECKGVRIRDITDQADPSACEEMQKGYSAATAMAAMKLAHQTCMPCVSHEMPLPVGLMWGGGIKPQKALGSSTAEASTTPALHKEERPPRVCFAASAAGAEPDDDHDHEGGSVSDDEDEDEEGACTPYTVFFIFGCMHLLSNVMCSLMMLAAPLFLPAVCGSRRRAGRLSG